MSPKPRTPRSRPGGAAALVGLTVGGRYKLLRVIGEGGMGAVYEGAHVHMHKRVAVKVLHPEMSRLPEIVGRFEREAMAAAHIDHPNVAAATDFGKCDDGSFFLVLEYVAGRCLRDVVADGRLEPQRALRVVRQIASALVRAHGHGIVHRDLKPENVLLVERDGDPDFVKVLDFGIAKVPVAQLGHAEGPALTQLGIVYGTPEYMAPEQAMGKPIDGRADLYALGVMLFEMLAGLRPFEEEDAVVLLGLHVTAPIPRIAEKAPSAAVPDAIEQVVRRLTAKSPDERFASARELVEAIDALLSEPMPRYSRPSLPHGSAPTVLSARAPAKPFAAARTLRDHLRSVLARAEAALPLQKLPLPITNRQKLHVLLAAGGLLLLIALFGSWMVGSVLSRERGRSDRGASSPTSAGIDERTRCLEAAKAADHRTTLRAASAWAGANPADAENDDDVAGAVRMAAANAATEQAAFDLLESKLGRAGADVLYDLAFGPTAGKNPDAAVHAKRSLHDSGVRAHMSPALSITIAIRDATSICDAKTKYFAEAARVGDERTLDALAPYTKRTGCGRRGRHDCHPCLRTGDDSVEKTNEAIRTRTKP